ncbi:MAG: heavy-metal-associated domain-containing protein [Pseudomonadota bacterium]
MIQLSIPKMKCGGCAASVEKAIHALDADASVKTDPATRRVEISSAVDRQALLAALAAAGFEAQET